MVVYDILCDSIFDAPRLMDAISGVVMCALFLLLLFSTRKSFKNKKIFLGTLVFLSAITIFQSVGLIGEWSEYKNNDYLSVYKSGEYEVVEGKVSIFDKEEEDGLTFSVNGVEFNTISNGYNNRGFHTEDYDESFITDDIIRVYYINKLETSYHNYGDKTIVKIEKIN